MLVMPILWTFRRCPYAMRARLAVALSGVEVEYREILLREKPAAFLAASPSGTVPCLQLDDHVIDESLDIMLWALDQSDPLALLDQPQDAMALIARCDGPFKWSLDRTKYGTRYPDEDPAEHREAASAFLRDLNTVLEGSSWLYGAKPKLADYAILPFVRQFANIDRPWFESQEWPYLVNWLDQFLESELFAGIMPKRPLWDSASAP